MALPAIMQLVGEAEAAGILPVAAIHHVTERGGALPRIVVEPDPPPGLDIDHGDLLARAQIIDGLGAFARRHPVGDAAAIAAAVKAEHQAGLFRRAAMDEGIDAKGAVGADQSRIAALEEFEIRPPHQRAIAENPEIAAALMDFVLIRRARKSRR